MHSTYALFPALLCIAFAAVGLAYQKTICDSGYWPFQVTNEADVELKLSILVAIVELELHQSIFGANWHHFPVSPA